jgi:hypothetical protein
MNCAVPTKLPAAIAPLRWRRRQRSNSMLTPAVAEWPKGDSTWHARAMLLS